MAGAKVDKGGKVTRWFGGLDRPEKALKQIGALLLAASQKSFKAQAWEGKPWRERRVPNVFGIIADFSQAGRTTPPKRRFEARPVLRDTNRLAQTLAFRLIGQHTVEVGSSMDYAGVHNFGGRIESKPITQTVQDKLLKFLKSKNGQRWQSRLIFLTLPGMKGKTLKGKVPPRQFVGLTKTIQQDIEKAVGLQIFESR